jgi:preprotein translocase subunit YajC
MNKLWKTGLIAGLLIAVLILSASCLAPSSTAVSGNGTGTQTQSSGASTWYMLIFLVVIFALFYFVMIRPQRKRQKEHQTMMSNLQKGDKVITAGGIYGTIDSLSEDSLVIKVEGGTTMRVARGSVAVRREESNK